MRLYLNWLDRWINPKKNAMRGVFRAHLIGCVWVAMILIPMAIFIGEPGSFSYDHLAMPLGLAAIIPLLLHYARYVWLYSKTGEFEE